MARYIDFDKIFPSGVFYANAANPEKSLDELINRICNLPAADVVPRAEVERLADRKARQLFEELSMSSLVDGDFVFLTAKKFEKLKQKYAPDTNVGDKREGG